MTTRREFDFAFLAEVAWIGLIIGVVAAVLGSVLTGHAGFGVGCLLASGLDTVMVISASRRAEREVEARTLDPVSAMIMVPIRIIVKAVLLGIAVIWPSVLSFSGTAVGALCFDMTLAFVGSALALSQGFRRNGLSR
jgi:peptidoglycan biosynthesis protein MviN/MurJ (putative lipid II flippase)